VPTDTFDVVDVDPRNGGNVGLWHDTLPETRWHDTCQGGRHYLLNHLEGLRGRELDVGVDLKSEGGFIVWWPSSGYPCHVAPLADYPPWLAEMARKRSGVGKEGDVPLARRAPPSASHVVDLLDAMENRLEVTRATYVDVMQAAKGCIDALAETGKLTPEEETAIGEAACRWAERWEGVSETPTDEYAKWEDDWSHRDAKLAGWQTLTRICKDLAPEYHAKLAAEEFENADPVSAGTYRRTPHWASMLIRTAKGAIQAGLQKNASIPLLYAPEWGGVLAHNVFSGQDELLKPIPGIDEPDFAPRTLHDVDLIHVREWLESEGIRVFKEVVVDAMKRTAWASQYHPVCDYLNSLKWDGEPRLDTWLIRHLGVEDTELHRAFGARWLIGAVARVRKPGVQMDNGLILEGRQGLGKSSVIRTFAGPWYNDRMPDLRHKDAQIQLQNVWMQEFAENALGGVDSNTKKAFWSTCDDAFRPPYGKIKVQHPRQCVFVITLNPEAHGYLKDVTGNRRYWPVLCGVGWPETHAVDVEALATERDQVLAEANQRYDRGEPWWLHEPKLQTLQTRAVNARTDLGPWADRVNNALKQLTEEGIKEPSAGELCNKLGLLNLKDITGQVRYYIGQALTAEGYTSYRKTADGYKQTFYRRTGPSIH
jgi:hypothetical protein